MKSISKMHEKCKKCSKHDVCNDKRMVACGMLEMPQVNIENMAMPSAGLCGVPIAREDTPVTINMGDTGL